MQPFQQWLQIAAATLHVKELEDKEEDKNRREGEGRQDEEPDDRECNGSEFSPWLAASILSEAW